MFSKKWFLHRHFVLLTFALYSDMSYRVSVNFKCYCFTKNVRYFQHLLVGDFNSTGWQSVKKFSVPFACICYL